jgi:hypothetical protein
MCDVTLHHAAWFPVTFEECGAQWHILATACRGKCTTHRHCAHHRKHVRARSLDVRRTHAPMSPPSSRVMTTAVTLPSSTCLLFFMVTAVAFATGVVVRGEGVRGSAAPGQRVDPADGDVTDVDCDVVVVGGSVAGLSAAVTSAKEVSEMHFSDFTRLASCFPSLICSRVYEFVWRQLWTWLAFSAPV